MPRHHHPEFRGAMSCRSRPRGVHLINDLSLLGNCETWKAGLSCSVSPKSERVLVVGSSTANTSISQTVKIATPSSRCQRAGTIRSGPQFIYEYSKSKKSFTGSNLNAYTI